MRNRGDTMPLNVLVVEDDNDARSNLRDILEIDGHQAEFASSISQLTARADLKRFAVILLDRKLPDGSGDDLLPYIRGAAPEASVMLVTGYANLEGAVRALRGGAEDFLTKPIDPDDLRLRLQRIAEKHQLRSELAETQRKLIQSERLAAIGQTVTTISHEARNELSGLRLGLELLPKCLHEEERVKEIIGYLDQCQDRLHRLFEDVRGFAAPIHLDLEHCVLRDVWRSAWNSLETKWKDRDVLFEEQVDPGTANLTLSVDAFRLEQVFRNLFENSLAACDEPTVISIAATRSDSDQISLVAKDNGPGLSDEQKQKLFEPFFTTKAQGTGLGMAIVRRIIAAHGGTITVADAPLSGAEFLIELPFAESCTPQPTKCSTTSYQCGRESATEPVAGDAVPQTAEPRVPALEQNL